MEVIILTEHERVSHLRKEILGLTMEAFGDKIGLKKSAVSMIESGKNAVTPQTRLAICHVFGVNEEWLRDGIGEPFPQPDSREEEIRAFVDRALSDRSQEIRRSFLAVLSRLTDEQLEVLADAAELLVEEQRRMEQEAAEQAEAEDLARQILMEKKQEADTSASPGTAGSGVTA